MRASSKIRRFLLTTATAACAAFCIAAPSAFAGQFSDTSGHWAENEGIIDRAVAEGIVTGYPDGRFAPDETVTRAQTVVMLARVDGEDLSKWPKTNETPCGDVYDNAWYTPAVNWAYSEGIMTGDAGRLRPEDPVSRQEFASILARKAQNAGFSIGGDEDRWTKYPDASAVSSWAHSNVLWAVEEGIMGASWNINPQGNATRAESTKMMLVSLDMFNGVETGNPLLKSHFIDVGQGDSCFVELGHGKSMLIDAGTAKSAQKIVSYIQNRGYDRIDYLVLTHPDADHIGGAAAVLDAFAVGTTFMPDVVSTTQTFERTIAALERNGCAVVPAVANTTLFTDGKLSARFVSPTHIVSNKTNENSAVVWMDYGGKTFYYTGDADAADLARVAPGHVDVLKVSHHGSNTGTSAALVAKTTPSHAVISCGLDNSYGHPTRGVLKLLSGSNVYRTDHQGSIIAYSDTTGVWSTTAPTAPVEPAPQPEPQPQPGPDMSTTVYVTKSGSKYHYDWCPSLNRSKNLTPMKASDAYNSGYGACKVCKPPTW